jgi:hypothetical protein
MPATTTPTEREIPTQGAGTFKNHRGKVLKRADKKKASDRWPFFAENRSYTRR